MNSDKLFNQLTKLEFTSDIPVYILELLGNDYSIKPVVISILPRILTLFRDPHICVPIILEFLLDQDRNNLYAFIIKEDRIHNLLFDDLLESKFYQHRLALCEILQMKGVFHEDVRYVRNLIKDEVELVSKLAIRLVDKKFRQDEIVELIDKFYDSSYSLQGACPLLLTSLDDKTRLENYVMEFLVCETWMVRYNLCKILNAIDINNELFELCCEKFVFDSVEEIRILLTETICEFENMRLHFCYIRKISKDESDSVRLNLVQMIDLLLQRNEDIYRHKFYLFVLQDMLKFGACEVQLLLCEVIARHMSKKLNSFANQTCDILSVLDLDLTERYNNLTDFHFLFDHFVKFSETNKWRSRARLLNMIIDFCSEDEIYFDKNLKCFLFLLLKDKVEVIRHSAAMAFVGLVNKFGTSFLIKNFEEIKNLVTSKKYLIRVISVEILSKIILLRNIEPNVIQEYVNPLLNLLKNDAVENLRIYYNEVMEPLQLIN